MSVDSIIIGQLETNCYFLANAQQEVVIVDPGAEPEKIENYLTAKQLIPIAIINTHGHYDHIAGNAYLQQKYKLPIYFPKDDEYLLPYQTQLFAVSKFKIDHAYTDNLAIKGFVIKVLATPGHTIGSKSLLYNNILICGDTMFADGYIGRTDLWGGSAAAIKKSVQGLLALPPETVVYPGHGAATTIGLERANHA